MDSPKFHHMGFPTTWARLEVARFCTWPWGPLLKHVETVEELLSDTSYHSFGTQKGGSRYIDIRTQNTWDRIWIAKKLVDKMFRLWYCGNNPPSMKFSLKVTWVPKSVRLCENADVLGYLCMCVRRMWSRKNNLTVGKDCGIGNQHGQT